MTAPTTSACASRSATHPKLQRMRFPLGKGVVGQVALTRQPMLLNDVTKVEDYIPANPDVRSELAVPLIAKNRLIGVMDLESEQPDYFRPEHLHLLTLTASRIAQAIENARLYTRVSRQAQTLAVLNEISAELTSILDLDPLLAKVGQLLRRLIDYQMFSIMLLDEKGETLITRYAWRFGYAHAPLRRIAVTSGLVGAAVREWRPINVPDVRKDQRYLPMNPETRSELVVPLFYKDRVIGVLDLEHTRAGFFNEDHERTLTTMAAQVAIAIENARLYQAVKRQEQQLERDIAMAREVQLRLLPNTSARPQARRIRRQLSARADHRRRSLRLPGVQARADCHRPRRRQRQGRTRGAFRCAGQRNHALRRACRSSLPPQCLPCSTMRCRNAASTRNTSSCSLPYGTTRIGRCKSPTPAPCSPSSAAPASPSRSRRRLPARHVSQRYLRRIQRGHTARRRHRLRLRRHSRCGKRKGRNVRRRAPRQPPLWPAAIIRPSTSPTRFSRMSPSFQGGQDRFDDETIIVLRVTISPLTRSSNPHSSSS